MRFGEERGKRRIAPSSFGPMPKTGLRRSISVSRRSNGVLHQVLRKWAGGAGDEEVVGEMHAALLPGGRREALRDRCLRASEMAGRTPPTAWSPDERRNGFHEEPGQRGLVLALADNHRQGPDRRSPVISAATTTAREATWPRASSQTAAKLYPPLHPGEGDVSERQVPEGFHPLAKPRRDAGGLGRGDLGLAPHRHHAVIDEPTRDAVWVSLHDQRVPGLVDAAAEPPKRDGTGGASPGGASGSPPPRRRPWVDGVFGRVPVRCVAWAPRRS